MKDLIISASVLRREFRILLICLGIALVINSIAILSYGTAWIELLTTLHYTTALGLVLYVLLGVLRLIVVGIFRLASGGNRTTSAGG